MQAYLSLCCLHSYKMSRTSLKEVVKINNKYFLQLQVIRVQLIQTVLEMEDATTDTPVFATITPTMTTIGVPNVIPTAITVTVCINACK